MNDSSTGGPLVPNPGVGVTPAPWPEGDAFDDFLHDILAGVSGLANEMVRPRWQQQPPTLPDWQTDWLAFGITDRTPDPDVQEVHISDGVGERDAVAQYEDAILLLSFYGPHAAQIGRQVGLGLFVAQNREVLDSAQVKIKRVGELITTSVLLRQQYLPRRDLTVTLRRQIVQTYPILSILRAKGTIETDAPNRSVPFATR